MDKFVEASKLPGGMLAISEAANGPVGDPWCRSATVYILNQSDVTLRRPEPNIWNGHIALNGRLHYKNRWVMLT